MTPVEKEFKIVAVHAARDGGANLSLVPIMFCPEPKDVPGFPNPDVIIAGPALQSEDAKILQNYVNQIKQIIRENMPQFHPSQCVFPLDLTKKEYEELGKPTINQTITLTLKIEKEEPKPEGEPT